MKQNNMENNTTPEISAEERNQQEFFTASVIFAKALSLIFKNGQGIVVDIDENIDLGQDVKKVFVFSYNNNIHIQKCTEDIPEGTNVEINQDNSETESEN